MHVRGAGESPCLPPPHPHPLSHTRRTDTRGSDPDTKILYYIIILYNKRTPVAEQLDDDGVAQAEAAGRQRVPAEGLQQAVVPACI